MNLIKTNKKILLPAHALLYLKKCIKGNTELLYNLIHDFNSCAYSKTPLTILLSGASGSGKTYILSTLANLYQDYKFIYCSAGNFSPASSNAVDTLPSFLKQVKKTDKNFPNNYILFFDEIDKLSNSYHTQGWNSKIQADFLQLYDNFKLISSNTLIILAGAFSDTNITHVYNKKTETMGFLPIKEGDSETYFKKIEAEDDLLNYGFLPEFVGRIDRFYQTTALKKHELSDIIKEEIEKKLKDQVSIKKFLSKHKKELINLENEGCKMITGIRGVLKKLNLLLTKHELEIIKTITNYEDLIKHYEQRN